MIDKQELRRLAETAEKVIDDSFDLEEIDRALLSFQLEISPFDFIALLDELESCKADAERYRSLPKVECEGMVISVGVDDSEQAYEGWRAHSLNYAKGEKPPATIETLQAAWDRDQELILGQKAEISRLKQKLNQARQKLGVVIWDGKDG